MRIIVFVIGIMAFLNLTTHAQNKQSEDKFRNSSLVIFNLTSAINDRNPDMPILEIALEVNSFENVDSLIFLLGKDKNKHEVKIIKSKVVIKNGHYYLSVEGSGDWFIENNYIHIHLPFKSEKKKDLIYITVYGIGKDKLKTPFYYFKYSHKF
jgi:hypothetical protein